MRLTLSLTCLLATLLAVVLPEADAAPARRNAGMITLPIRAVQGRTVGDLHPQLYLQQHINRGDRRLARMTGRAGPTDNDLRARLHKRMYIIGNGPITPSRMPGGGKKHGKRFNRPTAMLEAFQAKAKADANQGKGGAKGVNGAKAGAAGVAAGLGAGAGVAAGSGGAGAGAGGAGAAGNATAAAQAGNVTAGAQAGNATAGTGQGVSPLDIQAAENGGLTKAGPPSADNSLGLDIEAADTGYTAQLQLGTPPKNFEILMDSGSADFWVGSEKCQSEAGGGCGNHQFLGPQSSSTFKDTLAPFNVTYGTGEVAGTIVQDDLNLAGLQLKGHTFGTADTESVDFSSDQTSFDGLMGLAQSGLSQQQTPTPVEALASQGLINEAITSYKISRLADQKNDGEITFGGLDTTKFDQATLVTLANVNTEGFWEGNMDAVTVDGQDTGLQGRTAILDTGTTLIIAPPDDATAVHKLIQGAKSDGQGGFTVPCTTTQSVALSFGGKSFAIDPRDLAPLPIDPNDPTGDCTSGIAAGQIGGAEEWLVGDVFLKNAYFSTDVGKNTLSLAKLV